MTISAWVKLDQLPSATGQKMQFVIKSHSVDPWFSYQFLIDSWDPDLALFHYRNSSLEDTSTSYYEKDLVPDSWYYLTGVREGDALRYYVNGSDSASWQAELSGAIFNSDGPLHIGGNGPMEGTEGVIDEVRISSMARSPDWIKLCYINQSSNTKLVFFNNK
jgi:hypothetical protein